MTSLFGGSLSVFGDFFGAPPEPVVSMEPPAVHFPSVVVWDATEDQYLYELDADNDTRQIYSLTKLLTALTALDWLSSLTNTMTIIADDLVTGPLWLNLQVGDVITYEDLLKGMLIHEASDASKALCRAIGDAAYAAAGNTGTSGFTRGMEEISAKATALGLTTFDLVTPGGYEQYTNTGSARDVAKLAWLARQDATLQPLTVADSGTATITGANARSIALTDPAPYSASNTTLDHVGFYEFPATGFYRSNYAVVWTAPNGSELVLVGLNSVAARDYHKVDMDKLRNAVVRDFTYLDPAATMSPADTDFAGVLLLVGADSGTIVDESNSPATLTEVGTPAIVSSVRLFGGQSIYNNGGGNYFSVPATGKLAGLINMDDFTIEMFFRANFPAGLGGVAYLMGQWSPTPGWVYYMSGNQVGTAGYNSGGSYLGQYVINVDARNFSTGSHHVVFQRTGGGNRFMSFNGIGTGLSIGNGTVRDASDTPIRFGGPCDYTIHFDEIRISDFARYTNLTPGIGLLPNSTAKFPRS